MSHSSFSKRFRAKQSERIGGKAVSRRPGAIHGASVAVFNREIGALFAMRVPAHEFQILGRLAVIAIPKSERIGECSSRTICGKHRRWCKKKPLCYAFGGEIMVLAAAQYNCGVAAFLRDDAGMVGVNSGPRLDRVAHACPHSVIDKVFGVGGRLLWCRFIDGQF
ncbi:hypothetical protein [Bradyrhizobium sp.]|uniref:hypothetical protein n=1 Tax=Bradyrhizobium sp. TaxID=376 RepID=UPI0025B83878|nr:hypothetical protein [Bradyrhizobium sp.]MBV8919782.1 hypothetical protein [Bradyrhizobium sp.]